MNVKEFKKFINEKDKSIIESVRRDNLDPFKRFYEKWTNKGYYDRPLPDDKSLKVMMCKILLEIPRVDIETQITARQWLMLNGLGVEQ